MKIPFKLKRKYYKLLKRLEKPIKLNEREKKVIAIVEKQIRKTGAELIISPQSGIRYITSGDKQLNIVLTAINAIISNHKFHYDISLSNDAVKILNKKFDTILESRRRIAEREIMNNMILSLSDIANS